MGNRTVARVIALVCGSITFGVQIGQPAAFGQDAAMPATVESGDKGQTNEPKSPARPKINTTPEAVPAININGRPARGAQDPKVTIIEFGDFQCPFSAGMNKALDEVMDEYGDRVRLVTRDAPNIVIHPWSIHAAVDANCLASQSTAAYWEFSDFIFANQNQINASGTQDASFTTLDKVAKEIGQKHQVEPASLQKCIQAQSDAEVKDSRRDAIEKVGIAGVPTLFINGEKVTGVMSAQQLRERLDRALQIAVQPVSKSTTNVTAPARTTAPSSAPLPEIKSVPDI